MSNEKFKRDTLINSILLRLVVLLILASTKIQIDRIFTEKLPPASSATSSKKINEILGEFALKYKIKLDPLKGLDWLQNFDRKIYLSMFASDFLYFIPLLLMISVIKHFTRGFIR